MKIKEFEKKALKKEEENYNFRAFLKGESSEELDIVVRQIYEEEKKNFDCSKCMNCCKKTAPTFEEEELANIASFFKMDIKELKRKYRIIDFEGKWSTKSIECSFLKGNQCSIENIKPIGCKEYPFLNRDGFQSRLLGVVGNSLVCPIVFRVLESLKKEFNYEECKD